MDYSYKAVVSPFLTNGLLYMAMYVLLNHNSNKGQLFDSFDNAVIPSSLGNILLCRQNWYIMFHPKQCPTKYHTDFILLVASSLVILPLKLFSVC